MNFIRIKMKDTIQSIVDRVSGRTIDIITLIAYLFITINAAIVGWIIVSTIKSETPIIAKTISPTYYAILIALPITVYFLSLAGSYFKKPSRRIQEFVFSIICTTIFASGYTLQIINLGFVNWLNGIKNISVIPSSLLVGNIRLVSFFFPLLLVIPISSLIAQMLADRSIRKDILEKEIDLLLPTVNKMDDTTIDIKICEDIETGEDCIVPEKKTFEHTFLQGGTGSGKTATYIRPVIQQIFYKKSYIREHLKELAYESLEEGISVLNQPVTNNWFNNNFSMELLSPKEGKEKEFKSKFDKYIIGVRDREKLVFNEKLSGGNITLRELTGDSTYKVQVKVIDTDMEHLEKSFIIKSNTSADIIRLGGGFKDIKIKSFNNDIKNEEDIVNGILNKDSVIEESNSTIQISFPQLDNGLEYKIMINEKGSGKIVYKGVGLCVVAPDGGLVSDTIKIANEYNIKVHKIDPTMEEIKKGNIAKFNPLKGGRSDKVGDIISSILVSMDNTQGQSKSNPYFTNASVRAVRNLVILLKEMYPVMYNQDPTLRDILDCLNDFNAVIPFVEAMKRDPAKKEKWGSVISYFEACFYPVPTDASGKQMSGYAQGSSRKKTEDAISGIINQLDNFVTREEVAYILCDRENSIDLGEAIENGECLAIATRQNELGERLGKAFALFFILSIQNTVLSRYSEDENPEVPFHMIIDEFPFYINDNTKVFFTFARKYKCAVTIAIQNMAQLREVSDVFRETIFTNTDTKMLLPKSNVEDRKYWSEFFGTYQSFEMQTGVTTNSIFSDSPKYSEQRRGTLTDMNNVSEQEINELSFKEALYSYTDRKGRTRVGKGLTDFMIIKKPYRTKEFDVAAYSPTKIKKAIKTTTDVKDTEIKKRLEQDTQEEETINVDLPRNVDIEDNRVEENYTNEERVDYTKEQIEETSYKEVAIKLDSTYESFETVSEVANYSSIDVGAINDLELDGDSSTEISTKEEEKSITIENKKIEEDKNCIEDQYQATVEEVSTEEMYDIDFSKLEYQIEGE